MSFASQLSPVQSYWTGALSWRVLRRAIGLTMLALCFLSCATTQSRFRSLDGKSYPAKDANFAVAVFDEELPTRPFDRIARLDAHFEKTGFTLTPLSEAMPELLKQARAAGADAIIEVKEQRSSVGETRILHVTATAIRYSANP